MPACFDWNPVLLRVIEAVFARFECPLSPRRNDLQLRRQGLIGHLEAHLIVAFACASVRNRSRALAQCNLDLVLGDYGTRQRRTQQVLVLINRTRLKSMKDVSGEKFLPK